jgi:patatin-related protein
MRSRQLRIAPVMTGGTSLSVWMGGATVELYRMLCAAPKHDGGLYRQLLDLTATDPVVDVVTGTSAGGLNGTLLSAALNWRVPVEEFEQLRQVWMAQADIRRLFRTEDNPGPSLLDGNGTFVPGVADLLRKWRTLDTSQQSGDALETQEGSGMVDLVTTFTTLHPRRRLLLDDFRERMDEQVYTGTIRHRRNEWGLESIGTLAWGARVSASIPVVFEPVYLPTTATAASAVNKDRTAYLVPSFGQQLMVGGQSVPKGVWAVDGGLVNNLPLGDALDRIFEQPSEGEVRRVVLYVSPTPAALKNDSDLLGSPPSVVTSALAVVNAPRAEGVSQDLAAIAEHNRAVSRQRAARSAIPQLFQLWNLAIGAESMNPLPCSVMSTYRRRRAQESVDRTMARLDALLASLEDPPGVDRAAWRVALLSARSDPSVLPMELPTVDAVSVGDWAWGISPIELAVSTTIGLLNRALALPVPRGRGRRGRGRSNHSRDP